jgi:hypothetical protein
MDMTGQDPFEPTFKESSQEICQSVTPGGDTDLSGKISFDDRMVQ